jgi:hypothetical protein
VAEACIVWLRDPARWWLLPVMGAVAAVAVCQVLAGASGFPLDDAWIHQDFARTLATSGRFAYLPGRGGAGSTSPLWVLLLLPPQLVAHGQPPTGLMVGWVAVLGVAALAGLGVLSGMAAGDLARREGEGGRVVALATGVGGLAVVLEWHLVWAASSGMETDLFALLGLAVIVAAGRGARSAVLGLLAGLAVGVRPEGTLVAGLVAAGAAWAALSATPWERPVANVVAALAGWARGWLAPYVGAALVVVVPYLALNLAASGRVLPSTFYAKAEYYGAANLVPSVGGYAEQVGVVLVGSSPVLLALGLLSCSRWLLARRTGGEGPEHTGTPAGTRAPSTKTALAEGPAAPAARASSRIPGMPGMPATSAAPDVSSESLAATGSGAPAGVAIMARFPLAAVLWLWPLALFLGYAGHMTLLVHHGRYLMPALPPVLALVAAGAAPLLLDARYRLLALVGSAALVALGMLSLVRGAQIYADNVHFIDSTQVATARWLHGHTPPGALIATHDIGAIGYFSGRTVLDMAGLVDPGVIPLLSRQRDLEGYLARRHAAYVVMFTNWFPPPDLLARDLAPGTLHRVCGLGTCFVVYRTPW